MAFALAKLMESESDVFAEVLGEEREPDEALVILLDTSYSMASTGFAPAGDGDESSDDDDEEEESDSSGSDSDSEEAKEEEAEEEDGEGRLPAFIDPVEVEAPHELRCPLTTGIMLDPVIASDGEVGGWEKIGGVRTEYQDGVIYTRTHGASVAHTSHPSIAS